MSIAKRAVRLAGVLAACAPWACGAGAAGLFIENQSHQVFDGGSYDRLIVRNSDSITVRNARFAIASYGSVVSISNGENITFTGNTVHDIADDGFEIYGGTGLMIRGNTIYRLLGKGTDSSIPGPCYNGHSDGLEIARVSNSTFTGNLIFDVRSTAAVFISNDASGPSAYCRDLVFTNNVFVTPESGFTMYAFQVDGLQIHNNVIWKGYYGGLAIGDQVTDMDVTNNALLDAGDGATAPAVDALATPRPRGVAVDIGAIERVPEPGAATLRGTTMGILALLARSRRAIAR